jgi:hypothetical protein
VANERSWLLAGRHAEGVLRLHGEGREAELATDEFVEAAQRLGRTHVETLERRWSLAGLTRDDLPELGRQLHIVLRGPDRIRHFYFERADSWPAILEPTIREGRDRRPAWTLGK